VIPAMPFTRITDRVIDPGAVMAHVGHDEDGAVLLFLGVVRNHHDGNAVVAIGYEAYVAMAEAELARIADEASGVLGSDRIAIVHRVGELTVGEASVAVAVSSPHRAEAYRASQWIMDEIKKRVPVWKRERFTDGTTEWVKGTRPPVPSDRRETVS